MTDLFLKTVNLSFSASLLVALIIGLRFILKRAPKTIHVLLWGLIAIHLLCPFKIEFEYSQMPEPVASGQIIYEWADDYIGSNEIIYETSDEFEIAVAAGRKPLTNNSGLRYVVTASDKVTAPQTIGNTIVPVLSWIWFAGIAVMLLYTAISYIKLLRSVRQAIRFRATIYQGDRVISPFILGVINPKIYLPFCILPQDAEYVIAHEQAHIDRKDHLWKLLGFFLLSIHWFNPLLWLAYRLLCRDIELACDERVIRTLSLIQRADYSQALVNCSTHRNMVFVTPLSFGEVGVTERVNNILKYRKPSLLITIAAIFTLIMTSVFS